MEDGLHIIRQRIQESIHLKEEILDDDELLAEIISTVDSIVKSLKAGHKLVICGNGGSEADSLHFAGEIVGRFQKERSPWPAVVLGADPATLTAIANDYGYEKTFARQAKAFVQDGDVFIGISTSGNSQNIVNAIEEIRDVMCTTVGLLGKDGGFIRNLVNHAIVVPDDVTARIQESHITIIHVICELIEEKMH